MVESSFPRRGWLALALILLAVLPFSPSLSGDFIEDDRPIIRDRLELRDPSRIPGLFAQPYWPKEQPGGLYRPVTMASYALDRVLWGVDETGAPWRVGVHATNSILNALAALLVFALLRERSGQLVAAFAGAALFAVHPVHVEAVSHMVGRADLLMTVFFLAAFLLHARGPAARVCAAGLYLLACLCKEMAVVLPGVLLARAWLERSDSRAGAFLRRQAVELAPMAVALAVFVLLRGMVLGAASSPPVGFVLYATPQYLAFQEPAKFEVGLTMLHALGEILRLLFVPVWLSADYSGFPHATSLTLPVAVSAALCVALLLASLVARRHGARDPLFWLLFFALTWLPVSNLLFASGVVLAERTLYLPSLAVAGLAAVGVRAALARDRRWGVLPVLAIAALAALSTSRAALWRDSRTLYEETVAHGRHGGHIAKTGLVVELLVELDASPDPRTLERALALARASLTERPTATNLRQVAALEERAGALESALERRSTLYHFVPADLENRAALLRLVDRLLATREAAGDLFQALRLAGTGYLVAQRSGEASLVATWQPRLERAYQRYIDEAVASGDTAEVRRRVELLERSFPQHPLLERYRDFQGGRGSPRGG
ncbi:MAG: hypothetical protein WEF50_15585 [Myxococcota bacterium]